MTGIERPHADFPPQGWVNLLCPYCLASIARPVHASDPHGTCYIAVPCTNCLTDAVAAFAPPIFFSAGGERLQPTVNYARS